MKVKKTISLSAREASIINKALQDLHDGLRKIEGFGSYNEDFTREISTLYDKIERFRSALNLKEMLGMK